jgi:hypothetical protein
VSKDTDFRERSYLEGFPPKAIATPLRSERERVERFATIEEASLLILSIGQSAI